MHYLHIPMYNYADTYVLQPTTKAANTLVFFANVKVKRFVSHLNAIFEHKYQAKT